MWIFIFAMIGLMVALLLFHLIHDICGVGRDPRDMEFEALDWALGTALLDGRITDAECDRIWRQRRNELYPELPPM